MAIMTQIAKEAGVSVSTVSRVINNKPYVSAAIRRRTQAVIDKYAYVPNSKAVSLSVGRCGNIGVIIPYSSGIPYYHTISNGIIRQAFQHGLRVTFLPTDYDTEKELAYLKLIKAKEFDGMIIASSANSFADIALQTHNETVVCCEDTGDYPLSAVYIAREKAILDIIQQRNVTDVNTIGITFSRDEKTSVASRKVIQALDQLFGYFPRQQIYRHSRHYQQGSEAGRYFATLGVQLIFANGDDVAAGILQYYRRAGLPVPLIIGQDNTPVSELLNLPTIDFHIEDIGKLAVEQIVSGEKSKRCLQYTLLRI